MTLPHMLDRGISIYETATMARYSQKYSDWHVSLPGARSPRRSAVPLAVENRQTCRGRRQALCSAKTHSFSGMPSFMPQFSATGTRDASRPGSMSLRLGGPSECNAVAVEAPPWANSRPAFLVRGWNVDVHDCNDLSTI